MMKRVKAFVFLLSALVLLPALSFAEVRFMERDMCVQCHLMLDDPEAGNPVLAWMRSEHFRPDAACADCHGGSRYFYAELEKGHIGLPKGEEILEQCAGCHGREVELWRAAPVAEEGGCEAGCIDCHGHHDVRKASVALINGKNCGGCHPYAKVREEREALAKALDRLDEAQAGIERTKRLGMPAETMELELERARDDYADLFHKVRPDGLAQAAAVFEESLSEAAHEREDASPWTWYFGGALVILFLGAVFAALIGYENRTGEFAPVKGDKEMAKEKGKGAGGSSVPAWIALIAALLALSLVVHEKLSSTDREAVLSISETVSGKVMPGLKSAEERAAVNSVYELKRMTVTLDEIRETSTDEEVKAGIDKLKRDIEELSVKILVHE